MDQRFQVIGHQGLLMSRDSVSQNTNKSNKIYDS